MAIIKASVPVEPVEDHGVTVAVMLGGLKMPDGGFAGGVEVAPSDCLSFELARALFAASRGGSLSAEVEIIPPEPAAGIFGGLILGALVDRTTNRAFDEDSFTPAVWAQLRDMIESEIDR